MTPPRFETFCVTVLFAVLLAASGCESLAKKKAANSPYATPAESARDPHKAQELTQQAIAALDEAKVDEAEQLLREALSADLYHGPAHNNLGVVYLKSNRFYEAANEFEWARKLMPGHPDPRMNLALTLEHVGRIEEALATYETALEVYPNHIGTLQALCRCQLRLGQRDGHTQERLREIALRGESDAWRNWAQMQLARERSN